MGTKLNDACLSKVGEDEPIFVLRARDKLAPMTVRHWAFAAQLAAAVSGDPTGATTAKANEALLLADKMEAWQKVNGSKIPD